MLLQILFFLILGGNAQASTASFDIISVSAIGANNSGGVILSTSAYIQSGSSLTLRGSTGYIVIASSLNASSFFGDGSHLTGAIPLTATQTFSGSNAFTSSFTVQSVGRRISFSTGTDVDNLAIGDSGAISFYPELHNSSATTIPPASSTSQDCTVCIAGSTLTITTSGGNVEAVVTAYIQNTSGFASLNLLQDGNFVGNLSSQKSIRTDQNVFSNTVFKYLIIAPGAGAHSYCLSICKFGPAPGTTTLFNDSNNGNIFFVKELK